LTKRLTLWRERIERQAKGEAIEPAVLPAADEADGFEPAASRITTLFGLSPFEAELLVLAAGVEIDAALRNTIAQAQGTATARPVRLSFALALAVLPEPHWDALSPLGSLRGWSLIEFDSSDGFAQATLRIDERILHELTGVRAFDEQLIGIAQF